ncbi:nitric oxide reductase transcriptional regulator NorR [Guyparkeria sp. 1SP6A2]|nr:nitric oxide reductase transcriptional regulator NorR [Guyparkeria sp. 1SP6A2]
MMTQFLHSLRELLARLADGDDDQALSRHWQSVLHALVGDYPADASTLMVMDDGILRPVAVLGLNDEVRGREFTLEEHPRLAAIAAHPGVCRFPPDTDLPDPFDGLLDEQLSHVHDCVGVALKDDRRLTGILTLDALGPGDLDNLNESELQAAAELLATCLRVAKRLSATRSMLSEALDDGHHQPSLHEWGSPVMRELMSSVKLVAPTEMNVLLTGETGVGKEHVVRTLHDRSQRRNGPLVHVNCAALPESLIESALFGHRRGAFSGAVSDHRGHFAMADGGTLMLDEVGELPLSLQPKLLRVLQEGEIQPLGSERVQPVDVRVVAVTNRDLIAEVKAGRFREDLYHRLGVFPLRVPPLRERLEDIPLLAGHFLEENRVRLGVANLRLEPRAEQALLRWDWPGNVRELEHALARGALRALGEANTFSAEAQRRAVIRIHERHLDLSRERPSTTARPTDVHPPAGATPETGGLRQATNTFQRDLVLRTLASENGNWAATARRLDMDPGNLHRMTVRLEIKPVQGGLYRTGDRSRGS